MSKFLRCKATLKSEFCTAEKSAECYNSRVPLMQCTTGLLICFFFNVAVCVFVMCML